MAAPTTAARVKKALANPEPSTHGPIKFTMTPGTKFADLLGLPVVWPPLETA